jgi:uncharacterized membrane protein YgaE (UPF0421/DUF939 family)
MTTNHILFGLSLGVIVSCVLLFFPVIEQETRFALIIFNFLFISLTFPLDGTLQRKVCMLILGNAIGIFWNSIFSLFADTASRYLGEFCNVLFIILNPFLNLVWIVSFWCVCLASLTASKNKKWDKS